jgi:hypothetical protein
MKYQKSPLDAVPWKSNVRLKPDIDAVRKSVMRSFRAAVLAGFDAVVVMFDGVVVMLKNGPKLTCDSTQAQMLTWVIGNLMNFR